MELVKFRHYGVPVPFERAPRRYTGLCEVGDFQYHMTRRVMTMARFRPADATPGMGPIDILLDVRLLWLKSSEGSMMLAGYERVKCLTGLAYFPQSWLVDLDIVSLMSKCALAARNPCVWDVIRTHGQAVRMKPTRLMSGDVRRHAGYCDIGESYDETTRRTMTIARHSSTPDHSIDFRGIQLLDARLETFDPIDLRMRLSGFERTTPGKDRPDCCQGWLIFMSGVPAPQERNLNAKSNLTDRELKRLYSQR